MNGYPNKADHSILRNRTNTAEPLWARVLRRLQVAAEQVLREGNA